MKILSHTDLKLSFAELGALLGTRAMLEHRVIVHSVVKYATADEHVFNMDVSCRVNGQCGSVACIGGTMAMIMGMGESLAYRYVMASEGRAYGGAMDKLFYPNRDCVLPFGTYSCITEDQAIQAIDNFLTTGQPKWAEVFEAEREPEPPKPKMPELMPHTELNLSFAELGALLGTREMLKHNVLIHTRSRFPQRKEHAFNMNVACRQEGCGSVACIGGTLGMIMGLEELDARNYVANSKGGLHRLFYPLDGGEVQFDWTKITIPQSVEAIDNFLTTGEPNWKAVLGYGA